MRTASINSCVARWGLRVGAAAVVGAVLNVLVAWSTPLLPWRYSFRTTRGGDVAVGTWEYPWSLSYGEVPTGVYRTRRLCFDQDLSYDYGGTYAEAYRFGLPWRSVATWANGWHGGGPSIPSVPYRMERAMLLPSPWRLPRFQSLNASGRSCVLCALYPLWPGFALNTVFYAAIAWGLWQVPGVLRRRRRRAKGLCVRCGYDRAGLAAGVACPECGSGLRG